MNAFETNERVSVPINGRLQTGRIIGLDNPATAVVEIQGQQISVPVLSVVSAPKSERSFHSFTYAGSLFSLN